MPRVKIVVIVIVIVTTTRITTIFILLKKPLNLIRYRISKFLIKRGYTAALAIAIVVIVVIPRRLTFQFHSLVIALNLIRIGTIRAITLTLIVYRTVSGVVLASL